MRLDDDMRRVVREQSLGFVATVCADGTPNLSPKGTSIVWDDEHLAFLHLHSPARSPTWRRTRRSRSMWWIRWCGRAIALRATRRF